MAFSFTADIKIMFLTINRINNAIVVSINTMIESH